VHYVSTRGEAPTLDFAEVTLAGVARDGGLYVPQTWPALDAAALAGFAGRPYAEVAAEMMQPFVGGAIEEADLARMLREAYDTFRHPAVTPLVQIGPSLFILELFHGPTLAFKDVAMQFLARAMDHVLAARGERATIVVATSGDTGGAAVEAFRGRERTDLFVLYPHGRISDVQRRMITTAGEDNVHALAIEGTFDDCQAIVKGMFARAAFRDQVALAAVNSINFARIVAQAIYYVVAAVALGAPGRPVAFTVPTGNFGDVLAGWVAAQMGLPVDRLVIATNANDILARTLATGTYEPRSVVPTSSPSMDIQVASNFERLLFEACARDAAAVRSMMHALGTSGRFVLPAGALAAIRDAFSAGRADEEETAAMIRSTRRETGMLIDPHTAVAAAVVEKEQRKSDVPMVVLATAHPAKFPDAVERACGIRPSLPDRLADLAAQSERLQRFAPDQEAIERHVLSASRTAREGRAA
jgi:threonine synthase